MADNVAITAGSGTSIATDDAGAGGHVQRVKLSIATDGSATAIPADATDGLLVNLGSNNDVTVTSLPASTNTIEVVGDVAHDSGAGGNPVLLGGYADADADITDVSAGDVARILTNLDGVLWANPIRRIVHSSVNITSGFNTAAYVAGDQVGAIQTVSASAARLSGGGGIVRAITILDDADIMGMMDVVFMSASITLATDSSAFAISDADAEKLVGIATVSVADIGNNRYGNAAPYLPYWCDATTLYFTMIARSAFAASLGDVRVTFDLELD